MRTIINTPDAPLPIGPYNQAVAFHNTLYVSGQIALDPITGELELDDIETETRRVLNNIRAILDAAGSSLDNVLKSTLFIKDMNQFGRINAVYAEFFPPELAPARETVQVAELPKFVNIEISVIAALT